MVNETDETVTPLVGKPDTAIVEGYGEAGLAAVPVNGPDEINTGTLLAKTGVEGASVTVNNVGSPAHKVVPLSVTIVNGPTPAATKLIVAIEEYAAEQPLL